MANIADFLLLAIWPHRLIKDFEMPAWLGLKYVAVLVVVETNLGV